MYSELPEWLYVCGPGGWHRYRLYQLFHNWVSHPPYLRGMSRRYDLHPRRLGVGCVWKSVLRNRSVTGT
jgi:hypothetical protein